MNLHDPIDPSLEANAGELAVCWLGAGHDAPATQERIRAILQVASAGGDGRLALLSRAFEAVNIGVFQRLVLPTAERLERVDRIVDELRAAGWSRAIQLAEAAQLYRYLNWPGMAQRAIAVLRGHGPPEKDTRPAAERFWTDLMLGLWLTDLKHFDAALACCLRADRLARASAIDALEMVSPHALGYVYISAGDVDGALEVQPRAIAAAQRLASRRPSMQYNLMLAQMLAGRPQEAEAVAAAHPWLLESDPSQIHPGMPHLMAAVHAGCGRLDQALALLDTDKPQAGVDNLTVSANRAWLGADVFLAAGQPQRARALVEDFLAMPEVSAQVLSPTNGSRLYSALSQACEALGDFRASLDALKRSQSFCVSWVRDSVSARLRELHEGEQPALPALADRNDAAPKRLARRMDAVHEAASRAQRLAESEASAAPGRFLAHVTHEMRNPLHGLMAMTSLLALSDLDDRQRRYVELAQSSAQMLLGLCNDLLDLSKIEAGKFDIHLQPVAVDTLVAETVQTLTPSARHKGLQLTWTVSPGLPGRLLCDRLRLQQLLMNLIGNALKFTQKGRVTVSLGWRPAAAGADAGELRVSVRDTGPGIAPEARMRLFEEFSQGDASVAQRHGGTGLGLALCRSLVLRMGGTIDVQSVPGQGSDFWFVLPMAPAAGAL